MDDLPDEVREVRLNSAEICMHAEMYAASPDGARREEEIRRLIQSLPDSLIIVDLEQEPDG